MKFSAAAFLATSLISSVSAGYGEPVTGNDPPYYVGTCEPEKGGNGKCSYPRAYKTLVQNPNRPIKTVVNYKFLTEPCPTQKKCTKPNATCRVGAGNAIQNSCS